MTTHTDIDVHIEGSPAIDGLRFRRPRGDDADFDAIAALIRRASAADDVPWRPTGDHIREEMGRSDRLDVHQDVVLGEIDGTVVAEADVERVVRDGVTVFHLSGFVDPVLRRQGLGRALLDENIRRANERAAAEPADAPVELGGFVEGGEIGHRAMLDAAGFEVIRWFFLMRRDLAEPIPDVPMPEGLEIRPMTVDDRRAIFDAEVEAFRDHWGARVKTDVDFEQTYGRKELDTDLWVVAWDGDEVAGVVQNWIWPEENAELGVERGWLEHISVRRPWRRRGLARAITAESLRRLGALGLADAMLGVDSENANGALGLYEGLGFAESSRASAHRRVLPRS